MSAAIGRGLGVISVLVFTLFVTNTFDLAKSGYILWLLSCLIIVTSFSKCGLDLFLLKELPYKLSNFDSEKVSRFFSEVFLASFILTFTFSIILFFVLTLIDVTSFNELASNTDVLYFCMLVCPFSLMLIFAAALQAKERLILSSFVQNLGFYGISALFIQFLALDDEYNLLFLWFLASSVCCSISIYYFRKYLSFNLQDAFAFIMKHMKLLFSLSLTSLFIQLQLYLAPVLSAIWLSNSDIALLSVANRIGVSISFILILVNYSFIPRLSSLIKSKDNEQLKSLINSLSRLLIIVATLVLISVMVLGRYILDLFGEVYSDAYALLLIISVANFVSVICGPVGNLLIFSGLDREYRKINFLSLMILLLLLFVLTPYFGVYGPAISISFSIIFNNLLSSYILYKKEGILFSPFSK